MVFESRSIESRLGLGRILGLMVIVLLAGSTAFGQFHVQPMRVQLSAYPNRKTTQRMTIENRDENTVRVIDLRLVDVTQTPDGVWQEIEPDAVVRSGANDTKWVTVKAPDGETDVPLEVSKLKSCLSWLKLREDVITLDPRRRKFVDIDVKVPVGKRGYFCAALIAQTQIPASESGYHTSVLLQFVVPIIINVEGRPVPHRVKLAGVGLQFRPPEGLKPAASEVILKIDNPGGTYSRVRGFARIYAESNEHYRHVTDVEFPDTGIIPGVSLNLREDVEKRLAKGLYKVRGYVIIDGERGNAFEEVVDFEGDPRITITQGDAALELDPSEQTLEVRPGAMRTKTVRVTNTSNEAVVIDATAVVPAGMAGRVMVDSQNRSIPAEALSCADWVEIDPKQFILPGHRGRNVRVVARMPASAGARPNHYATIELKARFQDGQPAGRSKGFVYIQTKGQEGTPLISTSDQWLKVAELTPTRYRVTASFTNQGDTHVLPSCRGILTVYQEGSVGSGMVRSRFGMESEQLGSSGYAKAGNMLPFEQRSFTGVLDLAGVSPGYYRLTAILEHDKGGLSVQAQKMIKVSNVDGEISVEAVDIHGMGGTTRIEL